jgi:broad specificity phosphatase PhoE
MELLFVRHGEGEHLLDPPRSLEMRHPRLTERGRGQVAALRPVLLVRDDDLLLASPTRRTIATALILTEAEGPTVQVTPLAGPRIFPGGPSAVPLVCDELLAPAAIRGEYPAVVVADEDDPALWTAGINTIPPPLFAERAARLVARCRAQGRRALVITHDGTIHSYRSFLGERGLTRASFLGPAGWCRVEI